MINKNKNTTNMTPFNEFGTVLIEGKSVSYYAWKEIPEYLTPSEKHIGKRVIISDRLESPDYFYLAEVHNKGDRYWPTSGGYTVKNEVGYTRTLSHDMCRLHPISLD